MHLFPGRNRDLFVEARKAEITVSSMFNILIHVDCLLKELYLSVNESFEVTMQNFDIYCYNIGNLFVVLGNDCCIVL